MIEVIIEPVPKGPDLGYTDLEYKITIRIRRKDKVWETSRFVSYFTGHSLERVSLAFKHAVMLKNSISMKASLMNSKVKNIFVKISKT